MSVVWFLIAAVWAGMFFWEQSDKRKALKAARGSLDLLKEVQVERDHLRHMLIGMAGVKWVAADNSRSVTFQLSRENTFYVDNGETKH